MPTDKPRFMVTVSEEMRQQIDDYRFANKIRSQTQAINDLINRGLAALDPRPTAKKEKEEPDIFVGLSEDEIEFLNGFASLSASNRRLLLGILALLAQEQARAGDSPG